MPKVNTNKKGIAIYLVLGALIMAVVLAKVILNIILNQSSVTHHRLSRIQAYYASLAGINYAIEKLRLGTVDTANGWVMGANCEAPDGCIEDFESKYDFPDSILYFNDDSKKQFQIILCLNDPTGATCSGFPTCNTGNLSAGAEGCIYSTVKYTAPN